MSKERLGELWLVGVLAGVVACTSSNAGPACGDHIVETDEQCDDGNLIDGDGCDSSCVLDFGG